MGKNSFIQSSLFRFNFLLIRSSVSSTLPTNQPLKLNSTVNTSNKFSIDPSFIRQALFHPSNNTTNPVQFQVKL
jgi:hypothetical protein